MSDTETRIRKLLVDQLGNQVEDWPSETDLTKLPDSFGRHGNYDSLDHVEFTMSIEDEWHLEITEDAAAGIRTIADAVRFVETAQAADGR